MSSVPALKIITQTGHNDVGSLIQVPKSEIVGITIIIIIARVLSLVFLYAQPWTETRIQLFSASHNPFTWTSRMDKRYSAGADRTLRPSCVRRSQAVTGRIAKFGTEVVIRKDWIVNYYRGRYRRGPSVAGVPMYLFH